MTQQIGDPFQIKRLEKFLKRPLSELERTGQVPIRIKDVNGVVRHEFVKMHNFKDFYGDR